MNVLVAVASRHGSTRDIAAAIAAELQAAGISADQYDISDVTMLDGYDAAVLGSAVYMGNWMSAAGDFIDRHRADLARMAVWLFSSGPLGDEPLPAESLSSGHLAELMEKTGARDHAVFAGRLDRDDLGIGERLVVRMVHAPDGDYRDWDAIRAWARGIAEALKPAIV